MKERWAFSGKSEIWKWNGKKKTRGEKNWWMAIAKRDDCWAFLPANWEAFGFGSLQMDPAATPMGPFQLANSAVKFWWLVGRVDGLACIIQLGLQSIGPWKEMKLLNEVTRGLKQATLLFSEAFWSVSICESTTSVISSVQRFRERRKMHFIS